MNNEQNNDQPNERTGMRLLKSYYEALEKLNLEDKGRMYQAIMEYGLFDIQPDFKDSPNQLVLDMVWILLKPNMNSYVNYNNSKIENGKKGGRPSTKKVDTTSTSPLEDNRASVLKDNPIVVAEPIKENIVQPEPSNSVKNYWTDIEQTEEYKKFLKEQNLK